MTEKLRGWNVRAVLRANWYLLLLLVVCLGRLWLMPISSSFWGDETATAMLVQHPDDASFAAAPQLSATIYNWLPRAAHLLIGDSEIDYRLPSLLLSCFSLLIIGRIAARLVAPDAAWFAVFACLAIADFNFFAIDARPYALGIFIAAGSIWLLIRWLDSGSWAAAFLFALFAALLWRVHLAFWAFYPMLAIYGIFRFTLTERRATWQQALVVTAGVGASLIPVAFSALDMFRHAGTHVIEPITRTADLVVTLHAKRMALLTAVALGLSLFRRGQLERTAPAAVLLAGLWWLWMPVLLFATGRLSGTGLFVPRYVSPALPGIAIAATLAVSLFLPKSLWKPASALLAVGALAVAGRWNSLWPLHSEFEDWRSLSAVADLAAGRPDTPVIMPAYFIEGVPPNWSPDYKVPGFLYSPLNSYPVRGRIYPFPVSRTTEDQAYAARLSAETLSHRDRFLIYGAGLNANFWLNYFFKRPELRGWHVTYKASGTLLVAVFDRLGVAGLENVF